MKLNLFIVAVALFILPRTLRAEDWGTLSGRIVFTGVVNKPEKVQVTRDEDVCGVLPLVDESLIVNPKNKGLQNVVIWLSSKATVPVHPDFSKPPKPAKLDNKDCRFVPHIVQLRTQQPLDCTSTDTISHNVAVWARRNNPFSEVIPKGSPLTKVFEREELQPIRVDCSIHAWMRSYLVITEHPYSAVTDKDGNFQIPKLPFGEWQFRFWHERVGLLPAITVDGEERELKRGVWEMQIDTAEITLPKLSISELTDE